MATKEDKMIKKFSQQDGKLAPIGDSLALPNYTAATGSNNVVGNFQRIVVSEDRSGSLSGAAMVSNIIFGTGSTPPTASGFPIGTVYIQYTA